MSCTHSQAPKRKKDSTEKKTRPRSEEGKKDRRKETENGRKETGEEFIVLHLLRVVLVMLLVVVISLPFHPYNELIYVVEVEAAKQRKHLKKHLTT